MGVAFLSAVLVSCFFSPMLGIQCAVAVLVSACPCTLSLITPLAIKIGMKKAADHGVLFKSAKKMEEAAGIDVVFFDLNGTLTSSSPFVRDYGVLSDAVSKDEFFFLANLLEKDAPHGVAKVICDYINNNSPHTFLPPPNMVPEAFSRHGVAASIDGVRYEIGNQEMMNQAGITVPNSLNEWGQNKPLIQGDSVIYLARLDKLIGYFIINDPLRKDAIDVVNHLKASGKDVYLCTGADMATASRYGAALGIEPDHIKSQRAPAKSISQKQQAGDKMSDIKDFQSAGHRVAMVGDGSNDSCAVPASDFGIVVQSRCITDAVTQDNAGVVISGQSLWSVVLALTVAEQTVNNIKQNLLFSLLYNVGAMLVSGGLLLTLGVMVNPSIGAGLMILQSSLLLLNAYRFKQQPLPERPVKSADLVSIQKASIKSAPLRFFTPTPSSRVPRGISIDEHGAMKEEIPRGPFQLALSFS
jgi:Cu2+-exporting ATPase